MTDAFQLVASRPWLIQRESLETILAVADRQGSIEALQARTGDRLDGTRAVTVRDGVAVVPVYGPIFRHANLFSEISGATSTDLLARDIQAALDNPFIRAVVLDIDSPGGEATGIHELAALIHAGRARKRIVAYGGGTVASAAYWLASGADEIVIDPTAVVGSVGVVMTYRDTRERDAKSGVQTIEIVSSQSPDKRIDPATESGRSKVQAIVDQLAGVFIASLAEHRGITPEAVLERYGQGGVLLGAAAVEAGLADRTGSLEALIAELAAGDTKPPRTASMTATTAPVTVRSTEELRQALAAGHTADTITLAAPDQGAALAAAREEGIAAGRAEATEALLKDERARIANLQALARPGFEAELATAIDEGHTPEAFALAILKAAADRGITLDAINADAPPAAPHAAAGSDEPPPVRHRTSAQIFELRRQAAASTTPARTR